MRVDRVCVPLANELHVLIRQRILFTSFANNLLKKVWNITFGLNFCTYSFIIFT